MSQHIGPRVISATGGSIKRVGNYRVHTFPSELVTDGLVLNLDAGDPRSYSGSGTTFNDLSGNGNTGTLTNGPIYNNANGGSIVFDGTQKNVTIPSSPSTNISTTLTAAVWVYWNGGNGRIYQKDGLSFTRCWELGVYADLFRMELWHSDGSTVVASANALTVNAWNHLVMTFDGINIRMYQNSVLTNTIYFPGDIRTDSNTPIFLSNGFGAGELLNGRISNVLLYNRALSALEVAQNFDALRVRYTSYTNTFTPLCGAGSGRVEVLCVGGGGGGGSKTFGSIGGTAAGAGGGAGGLIYNSAFSVNSSSSISVSIGAGGIGGGPTSTGNNGSVNGANGGNSTFSSLTSIGGGGGGGNGNNNGAAGGSGGGAAGAATSGSGTSGQGNRGGNSTSGADPYPRAGGGGAGGPGEDVTLTKPYGNGGSGLAYSISGTSQFYAGGGGGAQYDSRYPTGIGGSGVGGNGQLASESNSFIGKAIPNTGSGGGGQGGGSVNDLGGGGNGSNGIVIVRYPASDYNVELLVVGGGGGGGVCYGGGGGAGGLLYYSSYPVSAGTRYTVTIGAGGLNRVNVSGNGFNGNNSSFGPLVAFGGGYGGGNCGTVGGNGGSGGGGSGSGAVGFAGGFGISGQGNIGATSSAADGGGGGGGAGAPGSGRQGGIGLAYSIDGTSRYYAGGGSGSGSPSLTGGLGGGGTGGTALNAGVGDGTANTGGGGGGSIIASNVGTSGIGGSGIVIIAYRGPQRGIGGTVDTTSRPGYTLHRFTTVGTQIFIP